MMGRISKEFESGIRKSKVKIQNGKVKSGNGRFLSRAGGVMQAITGRAPFLNFDFCIEGMSSL
jgi:hypothetical protein